MLYTLNVFGSRLQEDPRIQTIQLFSNIWGVGSVMAEKFYNMGNLDLLENLYNIGTV